VTQERLVARVVQKVAAVRRVLDAEIWEAEQVRDPPARRRRRRNSAEAAVRSRDRW
jgi:hypothetical protein